MELIKKALIISNTSKFMTLFLQNDIKTLQNMGFEVHCFTDFHNPDYKELDKRLAKLNVKMHDSEFARSPYSLKHRKTYKALKQLMNKEKFALVHCHTAMGGVLGRLAARKLRKTGTKVIYTTHGFHFFKKAPIFYWLTYYPVERMLSHISDVIITINKEDYKRAKTLFAKKVEIIPGIGLDYERFQAASISVDKVMKRKELHLPEHAFVIVSVGEVNDNKNHITMIRAIAKTGRKEIEGVICGIGEEMDRLKQEARQLAVSDQIHFLGFRMDIEEVLACSDVCMLPSKREGLGMAAIEGMAAGLPLLASDIHGIRDYAKDGVTGFTYAPEDADGFSKGMMTLFNHRELCEKMGTYNAKAVRKYSKENNIRIMERIYKSCVFEKN